MKKASILYFVATKRDRKVGDPVAIGVFKDYVSSEKEEMMLQLEKLGFRDSRVFKVELTEDVKNNNGVLSIKGKIKEIIELD